MRPDRASRLRARYYRIPRWPLLLIGAGLLSGAVTALFASQTVALPSLHPRLRHAAAGTVAIAMVAVPLDAQADDLAVPQDQPPDPDGTPPRSDSGDGPAAASPDSAAESADPAPAGQFGPVSPGDWNSFLAELQGYVAAQDGTYGVCIVDLSTGYTIDVNGDTAFPAASTFKLPMAMYILDEVEHGRASLDEQLAYSDADYEEGTGVLQGDINEGDTYTVRQLVDLAITQSDNIATNMLLRRFGRENVFEFMIDLGGTVTQIDGTNGTTPRDMARYMQLAHGKRTLTDPDLREFLENLLASTAFSDRAAAGVPSGVKVEHKIGTLPGVVNDVALVDAPQRTFIVAVLSQDVGEGTAAEVITEITRQAYGFEIALDVPVPPITLKSGNEANPQS